MFPDQHLNQIYTQHTEFLSEDVELHKSMEFSSSLSSFSPKVEFKLFSKISTFDIDGVIWLPPPLRGIMPEENDIIITGRSHEESEETYEYLNSRGIFNEVYFNPLTFNEKSRQSSGVHKSRVLKTLLSSGFDIGCHFEDDPVQAQIIREMVPEINVIEIRHNLVELENIRQKDRDLH